MKNMKTAFFRFYVILAASVLASSSFAAETPAHNALRLAGIFGDNMVFQADKAVSVWGWAPPSQGVKVKISGQVKTASAGADGKWMVKLDPLKPGGPMEMTVEGGSTLTVKNILVGEVWLCSGQSNMVLPMGPNLDFIANGQAEVQAANYPNMRLFVTTLHAPDKPDDDCKGQWIECNPQTCKGEWIESTRQTIAGWPGVPYFFGRKLHQELKVPVGLVMSAVGATSAEDWLSYAALKSDPGYKLSLDRFHAMPKDANSWDVKVPDGIFPTTLYNGEIAPLIPFAMRGAIWYQGESDVFRASQYRTLFPLLIRDWRRARGEDFPFYFVQLPNFGPLAKGPGDSEWAELREAQAVALALPNTGMAVTIDIGETENLHPRNKQDVGLRLALWALAKTYGQKLAYSGPLYKTMKVEGNRIRLTFDKIGGGLEAKGGSPKDSGSLGNDKKTVWGFTIAGADKKFLYAEAVLDGNTVLVSSSQVPNPVAVRYAWADNPEGCNLSNKEGLPASPFRTDTWPRITGGPGLK